MGIGVEEGNLCRFTNILGCKIEVWPIKCLGLPLGGKPSSISFWDLVIERIQKKLARWKKSYISLGGRITFINVVMSNVPIYYMSIFKMLAKVIHVLEKC